MRYSVTRVLVVALILTCTVTIDIAWKYYLGTSSRVTAKFNLQQAKSCVNDLLLTSSEFPIYNTGITTSTIEKALEVCARNMKVTATGDMFAYNLRTSEFIFDPSADCFIEGGKSMTTSSICAIHADPTACEKAMMAMNSGYDSIIDNRVSWKFGSSKEYLEWVILPSESVGFDGLQRGGVLKPTQVILAQGVIENELWARYAGFRVILYGVGFLSIVINLLIAVHENMLEDKLHDRRRNL